MKKQIQKTSAHNENANTQTSKALLSKFKNYELPTTQLEKVKGGDGIGAEDVVII